MAAVIEITQLSPTMEEGVVIEFYKKEGDLISPGDAIAGVETDKAVMDLEAFDEGILLSWIVEPGVTLPVGAPIGIIGSSGEDISELTAELKSKLEEAKKSKGKKETNQETSSEESPANNDQSKAAHEQKEDTNADPEIKENEEIDRQHSQDQDYDPVPEIDVNTEVQLEDNSGARIKASPVARNIAAQKGLSLAGIKGSGPDGRIVKRDVENLKRTSSPTAPAARKNDRKVELSMMRRAIAKRLTESKSHVPHFYLTRKIDITRLLEYRKEINNELAEVEIDSLPPKISVNDFIIRAVAMALATHKEVNARWNGDSVILRGNIDVGMAVAIEEGLITPIIRNADMKSLYTISSESRELAGKARKRKLQPEDYTDGSFTISNLGMYGIHEFQAIINAPEAALLAIGTTTKEPRYDNEAAQFLPRDILTVTLSCDHRVIDGAKGAEFLNSVAQWLENPLLLMAN